MNALKTLDSDQAVYLQKMMWFYSWKHPTMEKADIIKLVDAEMANPDTQFHEDVKRVGIDSFTQCPTCSFTFAQIPLICHYTPSAHSDIFEWHMTTCDTCNIALCIDCNASTCQLDFCQKCWAKLEVINVAQPIH
jgi:hypothetical protein